MEPQNIEQGMSNVEGPRRKMAAKSRKNARKTAKPDVGQGSVGQEMQATASRGFWWLPATFRGNRLRITLRNSTFPVRYSSFFCADPAQRKVTLSSISVVAGAGFRAKLRGQFP